MTIGHTTVMGLLGGMFVGFSSLVTLIANSFPANSQRIEKVPVRQHLAERTRMGSQQNLLQPSVSSEGTGQEADPEETLREKIALLKKGRAFLDTIPSYTVRLTKQEVVHGDLLDEQIIFMKYRRQPFSVYLNWLAGDVGREVIYIDGKNNGKMLAA